MKKLFYFIIFLLLASNLFAATNYVSQTAQGLDNGTNCANSKSAAWFNATAHSAGDFIYLCDDGGNFTTGLNTNGAGASGNVITLEVASGESVLFDSDYTGRAITVDQAYWTVQIGSGTTFEIQQWANDMVEAQAQNVIFDGLTIHDGNDACLGFTNGADNGILRNSKLYDCGNDTADENLTIADVNNVQILKNEIYGNATRGIDGILVYQSTNITIQFNYIHDFILSGGEGAEQAIDIKGYNNINVSYNYFKNITDAEAIIMHEPSGQDTHTIVIEGNLFDNCKKGINILPKNGNDVYGVDIISNIFINTQEFVLAISENAVGSDWSDVNIIGNTLVDNADTNGEALIQYNAGDNAHGNSLLKNNIVDEVNYATDRHMIDVINNGTQYVTIAYNRFYDSDGNATCDETDGTLRDCDHANIGSNNEILATTFGNRDTDLTTSQNETPAENLGDQFDNGIDEDTVWANVLQGDTAIIINDRDNLNGGVWGKGAYIYSTGAAPPPGQGEITFDFSGTAEIEYDFSGTGEITR